MTTILLVIHLVFVIALVAVILVQRSEGGALGIGGGSSGGMGSMFSSRGAANLLTRLTAFLVAGFMATSIILTVITSKKDEDGSILEEEQIEQKEEFELEGGVEEQTGDEENYKKPAAPVEK